jgi:hypothetical protein
MLPRYDVTAGWNISPDRDESMWDTRQTVAVGSPSGSIAQNTFDDLALRRDFSGDLELKRDSASAVAAAQTERAEESAGRRRANAAPASETPKISP